ncbi:Alanine--tRNA ligase [Meiothermus luteus]|jgi:alanyl-tRNA synthetase|uniref:Alanine--tRNA ligase n=1 Tax=Meiothermus luteus TaxID=2026184 RepID=A0A399F130_9DEIN|nr:alanyl-tRNA editing protein [Meiothermus luteus]RIH88281.1 Alanine--tRNA ligase [Meiothermus luteus]RMH55445.1 MAG: alanyl-tRNA editing protein [Deinococcota bacterium]
MRMYWEMPYQGEFEARVIGAWTEGGAHYAVLDRTLFYPTAGGQACDTGTLGGVAVLEVQEEGDQIVHRLERPLREGERVLGRLDWSRRYRHMQRHTAEHILGQAFLRSGGWQVRAVNMMGAVCTIDLDGPPEEGIVRQAEALANWAVYANAEVRSYFIDQAEAAHHGLRRAPSPKVAGRLRVVEVVGWDKVACGGLHVARSGEAGPIKVLKFERYKGGTRVYFAAGWEALELFEREHRLLQRLGERFSTGPLEVEKPIASLQEGFYRLRAEHTLLKDELAERIMRGLLADFPNLTIWAQVPDWALEMVGKRLAEWPGVLALLVAQAEDKTRYALLKHKSRRENLEALWEAVLKPLGARGGGALVKLGVLPVPPHVALEAFRSHMAAVG